MMDFGRDSIEKASVYEIDITIIHSDKHTVGIFDEPLRHNATCVVSDAIIIIKYE